MTRDTDSQIVKHVHDLQKRVQQVDDEALRVALTADVAELDRLYSLRLTQAHDERVFRDETEAALRKV